MDVVLVLFGVGVLLELGLQAPGVWRLRSVMALLAAMIIAVASGWLLVHWPSVWSAVLALTGLYRIFNNLRVIEDRMHERFLHRATLQTSVVLVGIQVFLSIGWLGWHALHPRSAIVWAAIAGLQLGVALVLFLSTHRRLRHTAWPAYGASVADKDLPTLTVAIPARNETEDLQACLESLVACNYAKLEVLVLDDCSQLRRTPEIIRAFAHDGVRFLQGDEPKPTWLAKNQAYAQLAREASGEYILFCGVDVRFTPDSLRQLVAMMRQRKKSMLSLLPLRAPSAERKLAIVQAMRYFWELAPPRRLFRRPPVLSTCWIIRKDALKRAGGFEAATRSIVPEAHFARVLAGTDSYSFMRANPALGIQSTKPAREQYKTAVRMRYPQLHRRPENVLLLTLAYLFGVFLPFVLAAMGFWLQIGLVAQVVALVASIVLAATYLRVVSATRTGSRVLGLVALPYGVVVDICLLHVSMWQYEFSTVQWKGRNICIPAMHVIPHLPKL